jgi:hypothetical protein
VDVGTDLEYLDAQFVPGEPGIAVERHLAEIPADIRAADADSVHSHERLASSRPCWFRISIWWN